MSGVNLGHVGFLAESEESSDRPKPFAASSTNTPLKNAWQSTWKSGTDGKRVHSDWALRNEASVGEQPRKMIEVIIEGGLPPPAQQLWL